MHNIGQWLADIQNSSHLVQILVLAAYWACVEQNTHTKALKSSNKYPTKHEWNRYVTCRDVEILTLDSNSPVGFLRERESSYFDVQCNVQRLLQRVEASKMTNVSIKYELAQCFFQFSRISVQYSRPTYTCISICIYLYKFTKTHG